MALYFSNTGYLFPYIREDDFMATYHELRHQQKPKIRRTWLGLLNIIFAMAITTKFDSDNASLGRLEESEDFYRRAVGLCEKQAMRGTSLEIGKQTSRYQKT